MKVFNTSPVVLLLTLLFLSFSTGGQQVSASNLSVINIARTAVVTTDSGDGTLATDGENFSTLWSSANTSSDHWLELNFGATQSIKQVVLVRSSGISNTNFQVQTWNGSNWSNAVTTRNTGSNNVMVVTLDPVVTTSRLRLYVTSGTQVKLKEIQVFRHDPQPIFVNQSGYEITRPKRFTAPLAISGTAFTVTSPGNMSALYSGTISNGVGDFSSFNPSGSGTYVVRVGSSTSVPFGIGPYWIQRVSLQPAINFMIDARCRNGNANGISPAGAQCGTGVAWRDSHQFSFELTTLITMYASNPDAYSTARMPVQATYSGMRVSLPANTPEIVRLIYWGVEVYLKGMVNHTLLKEQLAYFVYAYPGLLDAYIPVAVYNEARDYLFANWSNPARDRWNWYDISHTADLFQTYTVVGTGKGSFPPGHSIVPNLLMYEVALRENRSDATSYFTAASNNAAWILSNLSPSDPTVTKGQRMSEHVLIPSLVYFQQKYPGMSPNGIVAYVDQWASAAITRSENYWDFRRYDSAVWTIPSYNEPGNVAGFPASALAAASLVSNPTNASRLRQIAIAQIDNLFGRNPYGRHFSANAERDFEGVELGWFSEYAGGAGNLNNVRGVLDGAPQSGQYPYNPNLGPDYTEGWVAFNTAWNDSLAYLAWEDTHLWAYDASFINFTNSVIPGQTIGIQLQAPLNFNYSAVEPGNVTIRTNSGDVLSLTVSETSTNALLFRNLVQVQNTTVNVSDNVIQAAPGDFLKVSYGYRYWGECLIIPVTNGGTPPSTAGMSCDNNTSVSVPTPTATPTSSATLTSTPVPSGSEIIIDNTDSNGISIVGAWTASTFDTGFYGSNYMHDNNNGKGSKSVAFTPLLASAGQYDVFIRWTAGSNRASNVPVTVQSAEGTSTLTVNQKQNGSQWNSLGTFSLSPGMATVTISTTGTDGYVIVDAVRFVPLVATPTATPTPLPTATSTPIPSTSEIIIDNTDSAGISIVGAWTASTFDTGFYGSNYMHDNNNGKGSKSVAFTPLLASAGQYDVFIRWTAGSNRASNVPVTVQSAEGTSTLTVNQKQNGSQWNSLGTFSLSPGMATVTISTTGTDGYVIVDAVRFVPVMTASAALPPMASPTLMPPTPPTTLPTETPAPTMTLTPVPTVQPPTATMTPLPIAEVIIDNANPDGISIVGTWITSFYDPGYYGGDYIHDDNESKGSKSVTFTPLLSGAGQYEVFMLWTAAPNRATNVPVAVQSSAGLTTLIVNQQQNGGTWNSLGVFTLSPGSTMVTISTTDTDGYVIVDAMRFTPR